MSKQVQIYEVSGTNLLFIITDSNLNAVYYDKTNLTVKGDGGYVIIYNGLTQVFKELPTDFVSPKENSVTDLVEIVQGYINNIIPANQAELNSLTDILTAQTEGNEFLKEIKTQSRFLEELLNQMKISNMYNQINSGENITELDVK